MQTSEIDVKAIRKGFGETQAEFASRVGVHPLTISDWERNGPPTQGTARMALLRLAPEAERMRRERERGAA